MSRNLTDRPFAGVQIQEPGIPKLEKARVELNECVFAVHLQLIDVASPSTERPRLRFVIFLVSSGIACGLSAFAWARLKMTGFAWTTAILTALSYLGFLLCLDWLGRKPEVAALWGLPLVILAAPGLEAERRGRIRWALPFQLIAFAVLVVCLDVMAIQGPTFAMIGADTTLSAFLEPERQRNFSLAANGYLFLVLMLVTERAKSLDLRRASKVLEPLSMIHILGALYVNAKTHQNDAKILVDVSLYAGSVLLLLLLGPWRSRWRVFVGALGGLALGSYLLLDLNLVGKLGFTFCMGAFGLLASTGTYVYLRFIPRAKEPNTRRHQP